MPTVNEDAIVNITYDLNSILRKYSVVPLNSDIPKPPSGNENAVWGTDEFGNISVNAPGQASGRLVYQKSFWNDLGEFTVDPSVTAAVTNNQIALSGGNGSIANSLVLNKFVTNDENVDFELNFVVNEIGPGWSVGIIGQNTAAVVDLACFCQGTSPSSISFLNSNTQPIGTPLALPTDIAVGDAIRVVYSRRGYNFTVVYDNWTQIQHAETKITNTYTPTQPFGAPNTFKFAIWNHGGSCTITQMKIISRSTVQPHISFVGDSKTSGQNALALNSRFASLLDTFGPSTVFAGGGDQTAQCLAALPYTLAFRPKSVVLCIGFNDLASGVPTAIWQANYIAIVNDIVHSGARVIHLLQIPSNDGVDETPLNDFIIKTYPNDPKINVASGWNQALYLSSDNVHPSLLGHAYVASQIASSGYLQGVENQRENKPSLTPAMYTP